MSVVSTVITDIRYYINDTASTRFTDTYLLALIKRAVNRANRIAQRNNLQFAKKKATLTTVVSQTYIALPADFDTTIGSKSLFRAASYVEIPIKTENEWELLRSPAALAYAQIDMENSRINFKGAPAAVESLYFYYFPTVDTSAWTTASTMPWGGRLDDMIAEYVIIRSQNIDEMDSSFDIQLLQDFETQILSAYQPLAPTLATSAGWMGGMDG
jgi:hypothetical protein